MTKMSKAYEALFYSAYKLQTKPHKYLTKAYKSFTNARQAVYKFIFFHTTRRFATQKGKNFGFWHVVFKIA